MGSDKALLQFDGITLLERALQTSHAVAEKVYIVGARQRYGQFGEVIEDIYADCGPLGGIHAGLSATETELNLMLSVDMPLMTSRFLEWLLRQAQQTPEWIVVPDALGGLQPLSAAYRRQTRVAAERALKRGDYKISTLFSVVPTCRISAQEIAAAGFSPEILRNINTAEEFEELVRH